MIRCATAKDIKYINKLGSLINPNFSRTNKIDEYIKNKNYIILVYDDQIIKGFLMIYKNIDYFEIESIVIDELERKKGLASKIIEYFINNYAAPNNMILLEVAVDNYSAIELYKKFNFKIINIRKKYYGSTDAYVMKKVI